MKLRDLGHPAYMEKVQKISCSDELKLVTPDYTEKVQKNSCSAEVKSAASMVTISYNIYN